MPYFRNGLCVIAKKAPPVGRGYVFCNWACCCKYFFTHLPLSLRPFPKPDVIASFTFCSPSICSSLLVHFFLSTFRAFSDTPESSSGLVLLLSLGSFCRDKHNTQLQSPPICLCSLLLQRSHIVDSLKVTQEICSGSSVISYYWLLFLSFENIGAGAAGTDFCFYSKCMGRLHQEEALISQLWMFCPSRE